MHTTNYKKFKGEIENYVTKDKNIFESRIDRAFHALNFKTQMNLVKIIKKDGYHAAHFLYILSLLSLLKIPTVRSFCEKQWYHWSVSKKGSFYRFKHHRDDGTRGQRDLSGDGHIAFFAVGNIGIGRKVTAHNLLPFGFHIAS